MIGLGIFFASFSRNWAGEISVKRKFQASNLELFKTLIGECLESKRNKAIALQIEDENKREFDLN